MTISVVSRSSFDIAWQRREGDDQRFNRFLIIGLVLLLCIGIAIPYINVPEVEREKKEALPPQLARVIIEEKKTPPPPPPKPKPEEKKPEEPKPEEKKPEPKPKPKPKTVAEARKKASKAGLLAMQDDLAAMRESLDVGALKKDKLNKGSGDAAKTSRSLITGKAKAGSGGISTGGLSSDAGGGTLAGRDTMIVDAPPELEDEQKKKRKNRDGQLASRSEEQLRMVLERAKGSLYTLYNSALRKDPTLEGKVVFELVVEPDGSVSACKVVSSDLDNKKLERKLVLRLKLLDFGEAKVATTKTRWSIEFLPS
ncbi:AgmX/PglI C-terminal domain-containing protein [Corallincola platygyrae]|uniref:AgmX/PglI C-terminal domain-containing protein n=1 Tax=Corallincola platygyrae TaxID=1193278 RepID=A0ABW4XTZ0_9GAMM